jgi:hypothetical protein
MKYFLVIKSLVGDAVLCLELDGPNAAAGAFVDAVATHSHETHAITLTSDEKVVREVVPEFAP